MTFEVLPAIDLAHGRLVSVSGGAVRPVDVFGGSPLAAAEAFVGAGARWLHVVDVDRADGGAPDLRLLQRLAGLGAAVQASGGIESSEAARRALDAGATRVVLGSAMLEDTDRMRPLVDELGERCVLGIEAEGDVIEPRSGAGIRLPLLETLDAVRELGATRYLYTGLARVATQGGPDLAGVETAARVLGRPVVAAGGIRGAADALALRDLGADVVDGVVVGRALYEGADLRTILSAVASG